MMIIEYRSGFIARLHVEYTKGEDKEDPKIPRGNIEREC